MTRLSSRALFFGAALIVVTNAISLGGIAFNRGGTPDSVLTLTDRELASDRDSSPLPFNEDSGRSLHLVWAARSTNLKTGREDFRPWLPYARYGGGSAIPWLDQRKLKTLGIDTSSAVPDSEHESLVDRALGRDVYLVLEMNGPSYHAALKEAFAWAQASAAMAATQPEDVELQKATSSAGNAALMLASAATRLYIVDAGLDPADLRRHYPVREQYAVVRGHIRPTIARMPGKAVITGVITAVRADKIDVPLRFRQDLEPIAPEYGRQNVPSTAGLLIEIRFGRRFEPWIQSVRISPPTEAERKTP